MHCASPYLPVSHNIFSISSIEISVSNFKPGDLVNLNIQEFPMEVLCKGFFWLGKMSWEDIERLLGCWDFVMSTSKLISSLPMWSAQYIFLLKV